MFQHTKLQLAAGTLNPPQPTNVQVVKMTRPIKLQKSDFDSAVSHPEGPSAVEELRLLHKETREALASLTERQDWLNQVISADLVAAKKTELQGLLASIEQFAAQRKVALTTQPVSQPPANPEKWKQQLEKIKSESRASLAQNGGHAESHTPLAISCQLEIAQKELIVKKIGTLYEKLRSVDDVIGDINVFQGRSVSQALEEEMESMQSLDKTDIQRNLKKVDFIVQELNKIQNDNKHNLLPPAAKKEVQDFLSSFFADFSEGELVNVSKLVYETVENIELRTDLLNRLAKVSEVMSERRSTLSDAIRVAEENQEALRNLRGQTQRNLDTLKENKGKIRK